MYSGGKESLRWEEMVQSYKIDILSFSFILFLSSRFLKSKTTAIIKGKGSWEMEDNSWVRSEKIQNCSCEQQSPR